MASYLQFWCNSTHDCGLLFDFCVKSRVLSTVCDRRRLIAFIAAVRLQHRVRRIVSYYCDLLFLVLVE